MCYWALMLGLVLLTHAKLTLLQQEHIRILLHAMLNFAAVPAWSGVAQPL